MSSMIMIKPLSVNEAWRGRRFKTNKYTKFQRDVLMLLPAIEVPEGKLHLKIKWGMSNAGSDIDNPCKMFIDCLQKKYSFNDSRIHRLWVDKEKVKKGAEFIEFDFVSYQ